MDSDFNWDLHRIPYFLITNRVLTWSVHGNVPHYCPVDCFKSWKHKSRSQMGRGASCKHIERDNEMRLICAKICMFYSNNLPGTKNVAFTNWIIWNTGCSLWFYIIKYRFSVTSVALCCLRLNMRKVIDWNVENLLLLTQTNDLLKNFKFYETESG